MARIVVVEDSAFLRADLVEELLQWGHEVVGAADGVLGLEAVRSAPPDLVVSDLNMPRMGGVALMHNVYQLGQGHRSIPFIFLTGETDDPPSTCQCGGSARQIVSKPVDYAQLKTIIEGCLA